MGATALPSECGSLRDPCERQENRRVLLPNFSTVFFLRSTVPLTAEFAAQVWGTTRREEEVRETEILPPGRRSQSGGWALVSLASPRVRESELK